jgi:hypothetical protein
MAAGRITDPCMQIQTRDGEVELTTDTLQYGMVFVVYGARLTVRPGVPAAGVFQDPEARFVGCDPSIAPRAVVEVYGLTPYYAVFEAHSYGFARLRGPGAFDLWRRPIQGAVVSVPALKLGESTTYRVRHAIPLRLLGQYEHFVGIDRVHGYQPDIALLCCGHQRGEGGPTCTRAMDDHAEHEDLATGEEWPATWGDAYPRIVAGEP